MREMKRAGNRVTTSRQARMDMKTASMASYEAGIAHWGMRCTRKSIDPTASYPVMQKNNGRKSAGGGSFTIGWLEGGWLGIGCIGIGCIGVGCLGVGCLGVGWLGVGWLGLHRLGAGWLGGYSRASSSCPRPVQPRLLSKSWRTRWIWRGWLGAGFLCQIWSTARGIYPGGRFCRQLVQQSLNRPMAWLRRCAANVTNDYVEGLIQEENSWI